MATAPRPQIVTPPGQRVSKKRAPENETARERFKRVGTIRVSNALDAIRLIGQMGPSSEYEFTAQDAEKINNALVAAVTDMNDKLTGRKATNSAVKGMFD